MMLRKLGEKIIWSRARNYLQKYKPDLIGVTGSYGKTLTKDAIALVLHGEKKVRASQKSYNTPIGVALAILGVEAASSRLGWMRLLVASKKKEIAEEEPNTIVLELGADRPGDIDWLVQQAAFKIGVVTNIGSTHLRYFVNKDMVAHEKMSLPVSLKDGSTAVLNADDPLVLEMKDHIKVPAILYGQNPDCDIQMMRATRLQQRGFVMEVKVDGHIYECHLPNLIGKHQLHSVLAALAVAKVLGINMKKALNNLRSLKPPAGRMQLLEGVNGSIIIDDSYNAAPEATIAALEALKSLGGKRQIAILGDMLDLGAESIRWHKEIGSIVSEFAEIFVAVGPEMKHAQAEVLKNTSIDTHHFQSSADAGKWLGGHLEAGDIVLVKGSRAMAMEKTVARLLQDPDKYKIDFLSSV